MEVFDLLLFSPQLKLGNDSDGHEHTGLRTRAGRSSDQVVRCDHWTESKSLV